MGESNERKKSLSSLCLNRFCEFFDEEDLSDIDLIKILLAPILANEKHDYMHLFESEESAQSPQKKYTYEYPVVNYELFIKFIG